MPEDLSKSAHLPGTPNGDLDATMLLRQLIEASRPETMAAVEATREREARRAKATRIFPSALPPADQLDSYWTIVYRFRDVPGECLGQLQMGIEIELPSGEFVTFNIAPGILFLHKDHFAGEWPEPAQTLRRMHELGMFDFYPPGVRVPAGALDQAFVQKWAQNLIYDQSTPPEALEFCASLLGKGKTREHLLIKAGAARGEPANRASAKGSIGFGGFSGAQASDLAGRVFNSEPTDGVLPTFSSHPELVVSGG